MDQKIRQRIIQARVALVLNHPFFGVLASRFILDEDSNMEIPSMGTDGKVLKYDPAFVESLSQSELIGLVAHETLHCSSGHPWRLGNREMRRFNAACDLAINPILMDAGFTLPQGGLYDPQYRGMSAEQIYDLLLPTPQGGYGKGSGGRGQGGSGNIPPEMIGGVSAPDPGSDHVESLRSDWDIATLQAAQAAKMMGKLPLGLERLLDEIKHPKVDWKAILRRFVQEAARSDYSWRMPNQRYLYSGLYLPSLRSEQMPPIVIGVDTSGSIGVSELQTFAAEMRSIVEECKPEKTVVIYCDAAIAKRKNGQLAVDEFGPDEPLEINPAGGGGTDFRPVFDHVEENSIEPACLVYLTDLYGTFPDVEPPYPTLWASTTRNYNAPFGEVIDISE